jgi:hypothetical protein
VWGGPPLRYGNDLPVFVPPLIATSEEMDETGGTLGESIVAAHPDLLRAERQEMSAPL